MKTAWLKVEDRYIKVKIISNNEIEQTYTYEHKVKGIKTISKAIWTRVSLDKPEELKRKKGEYELERIVVGLFGMVSGLLVTLIGTTYMVSTDYYIVVPVIYVIVLWITSINIIPSMINNFYEQKERLDKLEEAGKVND